MPSSTAVSVAAPPAQQRAFALVVHGMLGTILWSPSAALWRGNQGSPRLVKLCSTTHVEHIVRANEAVERDLAKVTGQPVSRVRKDMERRFYVDAGEAKEYG